MNKSQLRTTMQAIIDKDQGFVQRNEKDENPQVKVMVTRAQERVELAQAVLWAINGDPSILRIYAGALNSENL